MESVHPAQQAHSPRTCNLSTTTATTAKAATQASGFTGQTSWMLVAPLGPRRGGESGGCVRCVGTNADRRDGDRCGADRAARGQKTASCAQTEECRRLLRALVPHGLCVGRQEEGVGGESGEGAGGHRRRHPVEARA